MGHSTNKVFWISMLAAGVGIILGGIATAAVFTLVIKKEAMAQVAAAMEEMKAGASAGPPPATVRVDSASVMTVQDRFDVVGRLQQLQISEIASEIEGKVLRVPVDEGDRVVGGKTVIAEIDSTWVQLTLKQAQADLASRQATLVKSESDLKQLERLARVNSAKPKEVTDMRARVESERAAVESAAAAVERAKEQLGRLKIIAPFDGLVIKQITEEGQWVSPGASIAEVISDGKIDAIVNVPEHYINEVKVGDNVDVLIDALKEIVKGEVISVTPMGSNSSRSFPVKIRLTDMGGKLLPGMSVTAQLPIGAVSQQIIIPRDALLYTMDGPVVWVAAKAKDAESLPTGVPVSVKELFGFEGRVVVEPVKPESRALLSDKADVIVMGAEGINFPGQSLVIDGNAVAQEDSINKAPNNNSEVKTQPVKHEEKQVAG